MFGIKFFNILSICIQIHALTIINFIDFTLLQWYSLLKISLNTKEREAKIWNVQNVEMKIARLLQKQQLQEKIFLLAKVVAERYY